MPNKSILQAIIIAFLLILALPKFNAQIDHLAFKVPDSILSETPFIALYTSAYLTTGSLWDRTIPHTDFTSFQGFKDGGIAEAGMVAQTYIDLKGSQLNSIGWLLYI